MTNTTPTPPDEGAALAMLVEDELRRASAAIDSAIVYVTDAHLGARLEASGLSAVFSGISSAERAIDRLETALVNLRKIRDAEIERRNR